MASFDESCDDMVESATDWSEFGTKVRSVEMISCYIVCYCGVFTFAARHLIL